MRVRSTYDLSVSAFASFVRLSEHIRKSHYEYRVLVSSAKILPSNTSVLPQGHHYIHRNTAVVRQNIPAGLAHDNTSAGVNVRPLEQHSQWPTTNVQVLPGISTLLYLVPVPLAAAHQAGSVMLLSAMLQLLIALRRPSTAARAWRNAMTTKGAKT